MNQIGQQKSTFGRLNCFRLFTLLLGLPLLGCASGTDVGKCWRERDALKQDVDQMQRTLADRDSQINGLQQQIDNLRLFGPDRPADAFAPVKIEITSLSGGADYDGKPGDDGINVYLRLLDADGDQVKAPGQIRIQLLDNTDLQSPRTIGVYPFTKLEEVRHLWHGRFGTYHYALKCPFPANVQLPKTGQLIATAEFADYLTGKTLTADATVRFK